MRQQERKFFVAKNESSWTREHTILVCIAAGAVVVSALTMYIVKSTTDSHLMGGADVEPPADVP